MDPAVELCTVDLREVAVIGVLDQQFVVGEWEGVDEAIAVALLDGGVHENRPFEAVIGGEADEQTDELLVADLEVVAAGVAAAVDHRPGGDLRSVGEPDPIGFDLHRVHPEQGAIAKSAAHDIVQPV